MDAERQPLLCPTSPSVTYSRYDRRFRPLTQAEVLAAHRSVPWRRGRLCVVLLFWAAMALMLSIIVSLIISSKCTPGLMPIVSPVHMSLVNLVSSIQA